VARNPERDAAILTLSADGQTCYGIEWLAQAQLLARGRVADCDCNMIACVCSDARPHTIDCRYRKALTCAVGIACKHGYDVCPQCDPCTCEGP
jgi:hypothetical protein